MNSLVRRFGSFLLAPALVALVGCGGGGDGAGEAEVVRIAVCGPMTGSAAAFGEMIKNAAKLKEKEINDAGGITVGGKKMRVEATDLSAPSNLTAWARQSGNELVELYEEDGVFVIFLRRVVPETNLMADDPTQSEGQDAYGN